MEKDNIKENQIKSEVEETQVQSFNEQTKNHEGKAENSNIEAFKVIFEENVKENSCAKVISANTLDQLIIIAGSAVVLLLCDLILKIFGYMFVKESGVLLLAGGIIYFIFNCIYTPIMGKTKIKSTIAKKILNIN